jgi:5'(3')-deoxyribonucleotidase
VSAKPEALFDCDGVLSNFVKAALLGINRSVGTSFTEDQVYTWDVLDSIGWEYEETAQQVYNAPGFCSSIEPFEEAIDAMIEIRRYASVHIVTSPMRKSPTWRQERDDWVHEHLCLDPRRVMHTSTKYIVRGALYVEDKIEHVIDWLNYSSNGSAVLWGHQYSKGISKEHQSLLSAHGPRFAHARGRGKPHWDSVVRFLHALNKKSATIDEELILDGPRSGG